MSEALEVLSFKNDDAKKMLAASTHLGSSKMDRQMEQYMYKKRPDGVCIINIRSTWEKIVLAARAIVAIENAADVFVISSRPSGQRGVLKFATHTGATPIAGRFTPGAFTNHIQAAFKEPRLVIVTDPSCDQQPIKEASYVNIPVIALCDMDSSLKYVDIAIPCNNKAHGSIGVMCWLLARQVLRLRGEIACGCNWDIVPDLFFYREPDEAEKDEQVVKESAVTKPDTVAHEPVELDWAETQEWGGVESVATTNQISTASAGGGGASQGVAAFQAPSDGWANQVQDEWASPSTATAPAAHSSWGGATDWH